MASRRLLPVSSWVLFMLIACQPFEGLHTKEATDQYPLSIQKSLLNNIQKQQSLELTGRRVYNGPPYIECPDNIETIQEKGRLSAVVSWQEPKGYDAEDGVINNVRRTGTAPGSRFSGENIIYYTVQDSQGRTASCAFSVKVNIIKCRPLPMDNTLINSCFGKNIYYGDECHFSCPEGYTLIGRSEVTCNTEGQFDGQRPDCEITKCPAPKLPHGGARWECTNKYDYNSYCTIKCADGFRNDRTSDRTPWDQATITCQANRTWTRMPECQTTSCPKPQLPTGGSSWDCSNDYQPNSVCRLKCEPGYQTAGTFDGSGGWTEAYIQCSTDSSWSGTAECTVDAGAIMGAFAYVKQELVKLRATINKYLSNGSGNSLLN